MNQVFPLIATDAAPMIAELLGSSIVHSELIGGGQTSALRRIALADGRIVGVKQYALGRGYASEGAALRMVSRGAPGAELGDAAARIPVPEILCTLDRVIAYRWLDGVTLADCRRRGSAAIAPLAAPLGQLLGALARMRRPARPLDLGPVHAQLARGRARSWLGDALADALRRELDGEPFDDPACVVHGDFTGDNVIVAPSGDRIAGVIDWEAATTGSLLTDVGSLFRHAHHDDAGFRAAFERGHGELPGGWYRRARLLDATRLVARLADDREPAGDRAELRQVIADLVETPRR